MRSGPEKLFDERRLVEQARSDPDSFAELYRQFLPQVHAFALRRTGSQAAAEDITSATFEKAYRNLQRFRWKSGGFAPWLMRIAANETIAHYRSEGRLQGDRGQRAMALLHQPFVDDQAERVLEALDDTNETELRRAIGRLPPRYQRAIALRYLAELEPEDAARAMGLAKPAFAVVLSRAMKSLRRQAEREGSPDE